ncbi:odorant receptor Or2-like [Anoplophora glabripennis]|uniref:odorant receptor Or2-like n=1 Tax=Anoplophora glabripennis TaxID=217634 RepID=UPI000C784C9C|nr:odorant receptor Or2-like [Anoplophora glabripennis]
MSSMEEVFLLALLCEEEERLLNLKIGSINLNAENTDGLDEFIRDLKTIVEYQQFLIRYVKDLNKLLSVPTALLMVSSVTEMCINMYILSLNGDIIDKTRIILVSLCILMEYSLVYGLPAQLLMDELAATADMIYHECEWYLPILRPLRNDFLIIIARSQKSVRLRAGNYHVINNQTILLMIKTAYSFYTFLHNIVQRANN